MTEVQEYLALSSDNADLSVAACICLKERINCWYLKMKALDQSDVWKLLVPMAMLLGIVSHD